MGPASVLRHCRRCFSECEICRNSSTFNHLPSHDREPIWLDRWGWRRIRHIAELVGEGRIPVLRLPESDDWPGDLQADRECCARGRELSVLARCHAALIG